MTLQKESSQYRKLTVDVQSASESQAGQDTWQGVRARQQDTQHMHQQLTVHVIYAHSMYMAASAMHRVTGQVLQVKGLTGMHVPTAPS